MDLLQDCLSGWRESPFFAAEVLEESSLTLGNGSPILICNTALKEAKGKLSIEP